MDVLSFQAHVYKTSEACAAFLANVDNNSNASVSFNGNTYHLPAWSVSILPDCKSVVFNTAKVCLQQLFFITTFLYKLPALYAKVARFSIVPLHVHLS